MDFLNKAYGQVTELFKGLTPSARMMAVLMLAVIVASVFWLLGGRLASSDEYLLGASEFSNRELHMMQGAFAKAGLNASEIVGARIRVPRGKRHEYLAALEANNAFPENFDTAIDAILSSSNPFESKQLREFKFKHATQKKLAAVISEMSGIEEATVQCDEIESHGLLREKKKTAVVAVRAEGNRVLDEETVASVRNTAMHWFTGVKQEDVTVLDLNAKRAYQGGSNANLFGDPNDLYAATKRMYERDWQQKIYDFLNTYRGVVVAVNVGLSTDLEHRTQKTTYDPQPTAVESSSYLKNSESMPPDGGRPGAEPNRVTGNQPLTLNSGTGNRSTNEETREQTRSVTGQEMVVREQAPLTPNHVAVSVQFPKSVLNRIWQEENPPAAGAAPATPVASDLQTVMIQLREKIEGMVNTLLPPVGAGENPFPRITVDYYYDLATATIEPPGIGTLVLAWFGENWRTLGMIGLGLAGMVMLRGMIRSAQTTTSAAVEAQAALPAESGEALDEEEPEEAAQVLSLRRASGAERNLRDELTAIVHDDPDAAAKVLRTWIGDAA